MKKLKDISRQHYIESIYHCVFIGNIISELLPLLMPVGKGKKLTPEHALRFSIQHNLLLFSTSFFEEYDNYFSLYTPPEFFEKERIDKFKYTIDPAIQFIKTNWPDLKKLRHHALAHTFRIDRYNFTSSILSSKLKLYKAPVQLNETIVVSELIKEISFKMREIFKSELEEIEVLKNNKANMNEENKHDAILKSTAFYEAEFDRIRTEINSRISEIYLLQ